MVSAIVNFNLSDNDDATDDDMITTTALMARTYTMSAHMLSDLSGMTFKTTKLEPKDNTLEVKAYSEYTLILEFQSQIYAISDGGADSYIFGKNDKSDLLYWQIC